MPDVQRIHKLIFVALALSIMFIVNLPATCRGQMTEESDPKVVNVVFDPTIPCTGDTIRLTFKPSGGAIRAEVTWRINGEEVQVSESDFQDTPIQLDRPIKQGDAIDVSITAFDIRADPGKPFVRRIVCRKGTPTARVVNGMVHDGRYTAKVLAEDPDGGPVKLSLEEGPEGLKMDATGNIEWRLPEDKSGKFPVKIAVEDDQGNKSYLLHEIGIKWTK